jgi:CheY-like chemotaxis protein
MPGLNGFETAAALFDIDCATHIPIIMLSSSSRMIDVAKFKDSTNIKDYLLKPANQDDIHMAVSTVISQRNASDPDAPQPPAAETAATVVLRVLLVEDNLLNQKLAGTLLKKWGHEVDIANDGLEALDRHAQRTYDLILMDLQMPKMGGFEATGIIREREAGNRIKRTPIIAMTANALEGDKEECIAHQMDDYLSKPFKFKDFQDILKKYMPPAASAGFAP